MEMISEQRIAATREEVWAALNDTEVLKQSMPGCESFEPIGENIFEARITTKVGPVKAKFKFKVEYSTLNLNFAFTGPTLVVIRASKIFSPIGSKDSQPGIDCFKTSVSLRAAHTSSLVAAILCSEIISIF